MPIAANVKLAPDVGISHPDLVNLYGCTIGEGSKIAPFVDLSLRSTIPIQTDREKMLTKQGTRV
jgi:hypothetical protein